MKLSEMPRPPLALSGLELIPTLQGSSNAGLPLLAAGPLPTGAVLQLRAPMIADLSATADADPGAGKLRWNNAVPASATVLFIDDADTGAADISAAWTTLNVGGFVYVHGSTDAAARDNWQKWQVSSVADASGYAMVGVTLVASAGTFADGDAVELTLQQPTLLPGTRTRQNLTTATTLTLQPTDEFASLSALDSALSISATGTWTAGDAVLIEINASVVDRALTWDSAKFVGLGGTLPATAKAGKPMALAGYYSAVTGKINISLPAAVMP